MSASRRAAARIAAAALVLAVLAGCAAKAGPVVPPGPVTTPSTSRVESLDRRDPSIVLVLMDDFSMDLLRTMRSAERMRREGASYSRSFVVDSLCCVSRASLLTGQYPSQHGVLTNTANLPNPHGPDGGWPAFKRYGGAERSVNVRLQDDGYTTGYVGKYLNQYEYDPATDEIPFVPPGWTDWRVVFGDAYDGWGFTSTRPHDGVLRVRDHPAPPLTASDAEKDRAYAGTVIEESALDFIRRHRGDRAPYFLEVAPYAPHSRIGPTGHYPGDPIFPPAFRDRPGPGQPQGNCGLVSCRDLSVADLPGWNDPREDNAPFYEGGTPAPAWRVNEVRTGRSDANRALRDRARMVQSVDRMVSRILDEVGPDTYVILTSDNGFHLGQHQLEKAKGTPYDSDVRVPLLAVGPGVEPGERDGMVTNLDLASTFEELAGLRPAPYRAGRSLVETLGDPSAESRDHVFFEHTWGRSLGMDPDRPYAGGTLDMIPSYVAVRGEGGLLVRVDLDNDWEAEDFAWEFYDYSDLGWERTNTYTEPEDQAEIAELRAALEAHLACTERATGDQRVPGGCR